MPIFFLVDVTPSHSQLLDGDLISQSSSMKRKRPTGGAVEDGAKTPDTDADDFGEVVARMRRRRGGTVHSSLRLRETSVPKPGRRAHRTRAFYRAIVPDNTVMIRYYCFVRSYSNAKMDDDDLTTISSFFLTQIQATVFPDVHVKRFTDCGRYLVCFSRHLCDVVVYRYRGISKGYGECETKEQKEDTYKEINKHHSNFESYFKLHSTASLSAAAQANEESFCKDFLLTAREGKYLVVASSTQVDLSTNTTTTTTAGGRDAMNMNENNTRNRMTTAEAAAFEERQENMEGRSGLGVFNALPTIESITFHIIRTETGEVVDSKTFLNDFMRLTRNQCATIYKDQSLAIVSLKHKSCTFLDIEEDGKIKEKFTLGSYCEAGDAEILKEMDITHALEVNTNTSNTISNNRREGQDYNNRSITGLTQKLLVHRFLDALIKCEVYDSPEELRNFHKNFEKLARLSLVHARQLDDSLLLLKFVPAEAVYQIVFANQSTHLDKLRRRFGDSTHRAILTIYDLNKRTFLHVVPCSAIEAMNDDNQTMTTFLGSNNAGVAATRATQSSNTFVGSSPFKNEEEEAVFFSPAHGLNIWQRLAGGRREDVAKSFIQDGILNAPNELTFLGNAASLLLNVDAASDTSQSRSTSPYFDRSLFQYDERNVSAMCVPKPRAEFGVKFTPVEPEMPNSIDGMEIETLLSVGKRFTLRAASLDVSILQSRSKRQCAYVFHPSDPFAMSITQSFMQPSQMCFHTRLAPGDEKFFGVEGDIRETSGHIAQ